MKIVHVESLISAGAFAESMEWREIRQKLHAAIRAVVWPPGNDRFTIYPESGRQRRAGNGVTPIKDGLMSQLKKEGWELEKRMDIATLRRPGRLDAVLEAEGGPFALEWETGNISSSHRALNKMALGLLKRLLIGGTLVVPSRTFYKFLTDRIGNFAELEPYLDLWKAIPCAEGVLEIVVVEHDGTSTDVRRIPKSTSGRALQ